jgi:cytochrome c-type biogenesis protein CcmH/NrfG
MRVVNWILLCLLAFSGAIAQSLDEGMRLFTSGKMAEAKGVFESVLKKDEKNAEAHYRLGLILLTRQFRNEDDAVDHMEQATELKPSSAEYQYGLGAALGIKVQNAGVIKQAFIAPKVRRAFERAVELDPKLADAHVGLAQYFWRAPGIAGGDIEKAIREAEIATQLDEWKGRPLKANILMAEKRKDEAVQEMKTFTKNNAKDWRAWRMAGRFFLNNEMTDESIVSYEKYTVLRPDTADSFQSLARAYLQRKDATKSIGLAKKALDLDPESVNANDILARSYELNGQKKEAREKYEKLLSLDISAEYKKTVEKKIKELQ